MTSQTQYLASLDQSTTCTKFSIYLPDGTLVDKELVAHQQISLQEGWLEHDPNEIMANVGKAIQAVLDRIKGKAGFTVEQIVGLGLCNQRETVVCWDPQTGQPLHNAIVWCDARTKNICEEFKEKHGNFTSKTGLPVSTYFTMFKIMWLLQTVPGLAERAKEGTIRLGTIDSWVAYKLTGHFVTDASNASRTHLYNILTNQWDQQLLGIAQVAVECLPKVVGSFEKVGPIQLEGLKGVPLCCILGDQQSSAYAHNLTETEMKITYGTGCFMLSPIGNSPVMESSFVTTILRREGEGTEYGFEVSVECGGGTINWAKRAGFLDDYDQLNTLSQTKEEELFFMPSFGTIFSPFWKTSVSGGLMGLNFNTSKSNILRALLDSISYRLYDNIKDPSFHKSTRIVVDGGMTVNREFMQQQANLFNKQIEVRSLDTCWGVAKGVLTCLQLHTPPAQFDNTRYLPQPQEHTREVERYEKWVSKRKQFYGWQ